MRYFFLAFALALPLTAHAQWQSQDIQNRLDRMERDMQMMQRQVATGEAPAGYASPLASSPETVANMGNIEEEMRQLRGQLEQTDFQIRQLREEFARYRQDTDFRMQELENKAQNAPVPPAAPAAQEPPPVTPVEGGPTSAGTGTLEVSKEEPGEKGEFQSPRDHYNYAFRLLNQTRYEDSAKHFETFTKKYPKDPLVGNAYYWLGETHYIRRNYVKSADAFRAGFEAMPTGPKAADNLLKLSMSLAALKQTKEACTVLSQVVIKFKDKAASTAKKAEAERSRLGCA